MTGLDTNVLVALALANHPDHSRAVAEVERLRNDGEELVISPSVAAEFLHVVTDAKRVSPAREMREAIEWFESWNRAVSPRWVEFSDQALRLWMRWMRTHQLGRKRILDTQYSAALHAHGVRQVMTKNETDFSIFGVFEFVKW